MPLLMTNMRVIKKADQEFALKCFNQGEKKKQKGKGEKNVAES